MGVFFFFFLGFCMLRGVGEKLELVCFQGRQKNGSTTTADG